MAPTMGRLVQQLVYKPLHRPFRLIEAAQQGVGRIYVFRRSNFPETERILSF